MSAHVLLNLFNELRKSDLFSIYQMTLKLLKITFLA